MLLLLLQYLLRKLQTLVSSKIKGSNSKALRASGEIRRLFFLLSKDYVYILKNVKCTRHVHIELKCVRENRVENVYMR